MVKQTIPLSVSNLQTVVRSVWQVTHLLIRLLLM